MLMFKKCLKCHLWKKNLSEIHFFNDFFSGEGISILWLFLYFL